MNKQDKFKWGIAALSLAVVGLVIAPIILKIIGGLLGGAIALGIGALLIAIIPAISVRLTSIKFKLHRLEVIRAPIETMQENNRKRHEAKENFRKRLEAQRAHLSNFKRQVEKMVRDYPDDAELSLTELSNFEKLLAYRIEAYKEFVLAVQEDDRALKRAQARYEMAKAAHEAGKAMEVGEEYFTKISQQIAEEAVDMQVDKAFAQMQTAILDDKIILKEIKDRKLHEVSYTSSGDVILGNILLQEKAA